MKYCFVAVLLIICACPALAGEDLPRNSLVEGYCGTIADKASDARIAWQMAQLNDVEKRITEKLAQLEDKRKDLQDWVEKRDQILNAANQSLVDIYAKMDPESAAAQLAWTEPSTSVSVLHQLKPRSASAILDAMDPEKAASLVKLLAATAVKAKSNGGGT